MPSRFYTFIIKTVEPFVPQRYQRIWHHPAGPKTIHFWAPAGKWALVAAGVGDINRPADHLSVNQSVALSATGLIWSRYSLVITPKNYSLFAVNVFVAATGLFQLAKIAKYRYTHKEA